MADRRQHEEHLAGLLSRTLRTGLNLAGRDCPSPEVLGAYFDHELPANEISQWELHFSACCRCQEQLAALARMASAAPATQPRAGLVWRFDWRWLAPAAAAVGAVALWVAVRPSEVPTRPAQQPTLTAENRAAPAPPLEQDTPVAASKTPPEQDVASPPPATGGRKPAMPSAVIAFEDAPSKQPAVLPAAPAPSPELAAEAVTAKTEAAKVESGEKAREVGQQRSDELAAALPSEPAASKPDQIGRQAAVAPARSAKAESQVARYEAEKQAQMVAPAEGALAESRADDQLRLRRANEWLPGYVAVVAAGSQVLWRVGPGGSVERSPDGGGTWQRQSSPVRNDLLAASAPSADVCWAVGRDGTVLRTADGKTWKLAGSPSSADLVAVEASDADSAVVTTAAGKRYATSNAGRTWRSF